MSPAPDAGPPCSGILHIDIAFDWGDEVDLAAAHRLVPAETHTLARRPRTPPSIEYRPLPLQLALEPVALELPELGAMSVAGELTIFEFAAVSVAWRIPFQLSPAALGRLAISLTASAPLVAAARRAAEPIYRKLLPAIDDPSWSELSEEYLVFQLPPDGPVPAAGLLAGPQAGWVAGLVRLESTALSPEEVAEALRLRMSYSNDDLFVADWPAAVLIDRDCDETLEVIEFANLQLLEYRHIDRRLDDNLTTAAALIHKLRRSRLPFWRTQARPQRVLGDLKVEANGLFERTGNVLKLVGDQYLARVYRLLDARFHLEEWEKSIQRKLEVLEGTYQILSDQGATFRAEFLEWLIVLLIVAEILLALFRH
jgi:hypothetical protein